MDRAIPVSLKMRAEGMLQVIDMAPFPLIKI
jgi:hypothetical protein